MSAWAGLSERPERELLAAWETSHLPVETTEPSDMITEEKPCSRRSNEIGVFDAEHSPGVFVTHTISITIRDEMAYLSGSSLKRSVAASAACTITVIAAAGTMGAHPRLPHFTLSSVTMITPFSPERGSEAPTHPIDFTRDIRPILSQHCFACHGPDEVARKARLNLTTFKDATATLRSGSTPVVPGDPHASELVLRIMDESEPMPPEEQNNPLTQEQITLLTQWIKEGAPYAPHWAYVPPHRAASTAIEDSDWSEDPIDQFILDRLIKEEIEHASAAPPHTLLRRLTYDLTGLPPAPENLDRYLAAPYAQEYEAAVDQLLASEKFGERMATFWLDLVRFADTVGLHGDQEQHIWPYRDWVINAFNRNMPFDQFTIEQIAGDLLPDSTQDQKIATGYTRLNQTTHEGGAQLREYRAIYMADRVRNLSAVWMGATVGCAECHDHKYDPYTARDFYALGAFFADLDDEEHLVNQYGGLNTSPTRRLPQMPVVTPLNQKEVDAIEMAIEAAQRRADEAIESADAVQEGWEASLHTQQDAGSVIEQIWLDDSPTQDGKQSGKWAFGTDERVPPASGRVYRIQESDGLIQHYTTGVSDTIAVSQNDVLTSWVYLDPENPPDAVMVQFNTGGDNWHHRAVWGSDAIGYGRREASWPGYYRMGDLPPTGAWVRLEVPAGLVGLTPDHTLSGMAFTQYGGRAFWDKASVLTESLPEAIRRITQIDPEQRTDDQRNQLRDHHRNLHAQVQEATASLQSLANDRQKLIDARPLTMIASTLDTPRTVRILPRGNWLDETGEIVEPAVPEFLGAIDSEDRLDRLDLARWLVAPISEGGVGELTARVLVNRLWALLFGQGLCPSLDDFGGQGRPPTYQALLDALALDLIESGWDIKAMVKRMVMTQAYQQSSVPATGVASADPENLLFARQSRYRLPAEMIRDTTLSVSGLLVTTVGGPSVKPYQPPGYYQHLNFPPREYTAEMTDHQWRRGLYMHWQRQFLHPMLHAFDAPNRQECTAQRAISNTPLAALAMMNDPNAIDAARALAGRLLDLPAHDMRQRAAQAMRWATCREPSEQEIDVLCALLDQSLKYYQEDLHRAQAIVYGGMVPPDISHDRALLAAWVDVSRAVLNLHETLTRD